MGLPEYNTKKKEDESMNEATGKRMYLSPLGPLLLWENGRGVCRVDFMEDGFEAAAEGTQIFLPEAEKQLAEYFRGERRAFDLPLSALGTAFQLAVWKELTRIPYGKTISYGQLAQNLGKPGAARAVGMACHFNPLPLIVPCHRVIGGDGGLAGYAGGLHRKKKLLQMEKEDAEAER